MRIPSWLVRIFDRLLPYYAIMPVLRRRVTTHVAPGVNPRSVLDCRPLCAGLLLTRNGLEGLCRLPCTVYPSVNHCYTRMSTTKRGNQGSAKVPNVSSFSVTPAVANARTYEVLDKVADKLKGYVTNFTPSKKEMRDHRDMVQAKLAHRVFGFGIERPNKEYRESYVLVRRDKRNPARVLHEAEFQGFLPIVGASAIIGATGFLCRKIGSAIDRIGKAADEVTELAATSSDYVAAMRSSVKALKAKLGPFLWAVPFVLVSYYLFPKLPEAVKPIFCLAFSTVVGYGMWQVIEHFFPIFDHNTQLQSGAKTSDCGKLLASVLSFSAFKGKNSERNVGEFVKRMSAFDRFAESFDSFVDWITSCLDKLFTFCHERFGLPRLGWFRKERTALMKWCDKIDALVCKSLETARTNPSDLKEMTELLIEGNWFLDKLRGTSSHRLVSEYMMKITNFMTPFQGAINARNNFRFEPLCMVLYGSSRIGKTLMNMYIAATVLKATGIVPPNATPDEVLREVWQKGASQYWNGYAEQALLAIDDAFQKVAVPGDEESDYMNIIKLVGSFSCPLNFADLASKGKIYFLSKFILATTNLSSLQNQAVRVINAPEAVSNRFTFPYEVRVAKGYTLEDDDVKLDYEKFKVELARVSNSFNILDRFPWYMWEARRHDFLTGNPIGNNWISMRAVMEDVVETTKARLAGHSSIERNLHNFLSGPSDPSSAELQAGSSVVSDTEPVTPCSVDPGDYHAVHPQRKQVLRDLKEVRSRLEKSLDDEEHDLAEDCSAWAKFVKYTAVAGAVIGGVVVLRLAIKLVWGLLTELFHITMTPFRRRSPKAERQSNRHEGPKAKITKAAMFQGFSDPFCTNVRNNTYTLTVKTDEGYAHIGTVLFLVDTLCVQPAHFSDDVRKHIANGLITRDSEITLAHNEAGSFTMAENDKRVSSFLVRMSVGAYLDMRRHTIPSRELEFISFGSVRSHANVTSYFLRESDVKSIGGMPAQLSLYRPATQTAFLRYSEGIPSITTMRSIVAGGKKVEKVVSYTADTKAGDCGSPLMLCNAEHFGCRRAVGIHIAGNVVERLGYASVVTQEDIAVAREVLKIIRDEFVEDLEKRGNIKLEAGFELPYDGGSMLPIGKVSRRANLVSRTAYYKTSLYGKWGEYTCSPAHMKPVIVDGRKVYPMVQAVAPYTSPVLIYEQPCLRQAVHVAMGPLRTATRDFSRRLFTFEEAVLGVPQEKFRAIPRTTSAGYPYCLDHDNGKKDFFGEGEEYDLSGAWCAELRERVEYVLARAAEGVRLAHVYMDFLKDELRSEAKNAAVATRLISCAPLDYTIAWRMMFGAFSTAVFRTNTVTGLAPGICTFSDWDKLALRLSSKGALCFDGDFKAFDSSEQPCIHMLILEAINAWYDDGPVNARIREVLWCDLVHSRHLTGIGNMQEYLVQWNKSLPSGHPFTTIINSLYSMVLLVAAYMLLTGDLVGFWSCVFSATYGDDNVSNVSDVVADVFNQAAVSDIFWEEFGLVYTSADKTGVLGTVRPLHEMSFLKRGFRLEGDRWLCPLELDSFLYTAYWCKNRRLEREIIVDVLENALEELSLHEETCWEQYSRALIEELASRSTLSMPLPRVVPDRQSYQKLVLSRVDNWY